MAGAGLWRSGVRDLASLDASWGAGVGMAGRPDAGTSRMVGALAMLPLRGIHPHGALGGGTGVPGLSHTPADRRRLPERSTGPVFLVFLYPIFGPFRRHARPMVARRHVIGYVICTCAAARRPPHRRSSGACRHKCPYRRLCINDRTLVAIILTPRSIRPFFACRPPFIASPTVVAGSPDHAATRVV
jgi:hypothetical protein